MTEADPSPHFYYDLFENRLITGDTAYDEALEAGSHPQDLVDLRNLLREPEQYVEALPDNAVRLINKQSPYTSDQVVEIAYWLGHEVMDENDRVTKEHFLALYKLGLGASNRRIKNLGGYGAMYQAAELRNALKRGEFDDWDIDDYTVYVSAHVDHSHKNGPTLVKALNEAHRRGEGPNYQMIRANVPGGIPRLLNRGGIYYFKGVPDKYYLEWGVDFKFSNNGRQITTPDLNTLSPKQLSPSTTPVFDRFKTMENFNNKVDDRYYTELERITARNAHKFRTIMQSLHFGSLPTSLFVDCTNETELRQVAGKHELMVQLCRPSMPLDDLEEFARRGTNKEVIHAIMYYRQDLRAIDITRFATDIDVFEDIWPNSRNKPVLKV